MALVPPPQAFSCDHQLVAHPVGELQVFANGVLQKQGRDYTITTAPGDFIVIHPVDPDSWWEFSAVYFRRTAMSREDWTCK